MSRESLLHWKSLSIFLILPSFDNSSQMNTYHPYSTSYSLIAMNLEIKRSILYDYAYFLRECATLLSVMISFLLLEALL